MKKLFNNRGATLIEVVAATVILGIVAVPLLNTLLQTTVLNVKSDVALKMNTEMQRAVELLKANTDISEYKDVSAENSNTPTWEAYYTKNFLKANASNYDYKLVISKPNYNTIGTNADYDRWDFGIKVKPINDSQCKVEMYENDGEIMGGNAGLISKAGGKIFSTDTYVVSSADNKTGTNLLLDVIGKTGDAEPYKVKSIKGLDDTKSYITGIDESFTPGHGKIYTPSSSTPENMIVFNVIKEKDSTIAPDEPKFYLNIKNSTCFDNYGTGKLTLNNGNIIYNKKIIVNVFNYNPSNPKLIVNGSGAEPFVDVYRTDLDYNQIKNGNVINIQVKDKKGNIVKEVTNAIGK